MTLNRRTVLLLGAPLWLSLAVPVAPASAATSLGTIQGNTDLPAATVLLEAETVTAHDANGATDYADPVVAYGTTDTQGHFSIDLPDNATTQAAVVGGWVNTLVVVTNGVKSTAAYAPVRVDASGDVGSTDQVVAGVDSLGDLPASDTLTSPQPVTVPADNTVCTWSTIASSEQPTRTGEVHVANATGMTAKFTYSRQEDSAFSVGWSMDQTNWKTSGTYELSNSIATAGSYTESAGNRSYANSHMYYRKYMSNGVATCPYNRFKTHAVKSTGDAFRGPNDPGTAPWASCHDDPNGYATVAYGGTWERDRATAKKYATVASAFGYNFSGSTGYTNGIHIGYANDGTSNTFLCGTKQMPDAPVIYSKAN